MRVYNASNTRNICAGLNWNDANISRLRDGWDGKSSLAKRDVQVYSQKILSLETKEFLRYHNVLMNQKGTYL